MIRDCRPFPAAYGINTLNEFDARKLTLKVIPKTHPDVRRLVRGHCQSRLIFDILPQLQSARL